MNDETPAPAAPRSGKLLWFIRITVVLVLGLVLAGAGIYYHLLERRTTGMWFSSAGVRLHFTEEGAGPPVILIHGLAINADLNWRHTGVIDALGDSYRVIALDLRGHGLSRKPIMPMSYGQHMVDDVVRLMDRLHIRQAHVVGYSMGGFVTLNLLDRYPDRLLSAVVCGAGWMSPAEHMGVLDELADSLSAGDGFGPLLRFIEPGGDPAWLKVFLKDAYLRRINQEESIAALVRSLPALAVEEQRLRENSVPVLSIIGSRDPLKPGVDAMTGVLANHEVAVLEDADHSTTLLRAEFPQAIRAWLDRQSHEQPDSALELTRPGIR